MWHIVWRMPVPQATFIQDQSNCRIWKFGWLYVTMPWFYIHCHNHLTNPSYDLYKTKHRIRKKHSLRRLINTKQQRVEKDRLKQWQLQQWYSKQYKRVIIGMQQAKKRQCSTITFLPKAKTECLTVNWPTSIDKKRPKKWACVTPARSGQVWRKRQ